MPTESDESREIADLDRWQVEEIKKGIDEADRGESASNDEVEQSLKRWMPWRPTGNCSSRTHGKG
jgi:predicted transcriptional regulator